MKFEVGDLIIGNELADDRYNMTNSSATLRVCRVYKDRRGLSKFEGEIVNHTEDINRIGETFSNLLVECFDLLKSGKSEIPTDDEINDFLS